SISAASGSAAKFVDATAAANALVGNAIGANTFMLGYAYQAGYVPLSSEAIRHAIELNGEAVAMNLSAFDWGRAAVANSSLIEASLQRGAPASMAAEQSLKEIVARRAAFLVAY